MGTLTDQPVHKPSDRLLTLARDIAYDAKLLAKEEGISFDQALKVFEIASRERIVDLGYSIHNVHDEHINGFAKMLGAKWDVEVP